MKPPSPRADQLRQQREEKYGHLQATVDPSTPAEIVKARIEHDKAERLVELRKAAEQKCRPYAGKISKGEADRKMKAPRKPRKPKGTKA